MSEGPIKRGRDAWKPPVVSTTAKDRVCLNVEGRSYCGRKNKNTTAVWAHCTCADCHAARRADEAAGAKK